MHHARYTWQKSEFGLAEMAADGCAVYTQVSLHFFLCDTAAQALFRALDLDLN